MAQPSRVLFVCSANLCRSVMAAEYARRAVASLAHPTMDWQIASVGTDVSPNQALPSRARKAMQRLDIPLRTEPRLVSEPDVRSADLILTAERYHRSEIVRRFPFTVRYTFTLLELARAIEIGRTLAPDVTVTSPADLLTLAQMARGHVRNAADSSTDIADPLSSRSGRAVVACARTIESAVASIIR